MMHPNRGDSDFQGRRAFLQRAGIIAAAGFLYPRGARSEAFVTLPFENGSRPLVQYAQKRPLIRLTTRPPQLETPFAVFNEGIVTPNDAFFVRYHLPDIPTKIDPDNFRLEVKGRVNRPLALSLADIKRLEPVEIMAVNQCSGNSRGFMQPRVPGGQLGHGAMGNALWRGVRLKEILDRASVAAGAKQVTFNGMDRPVIEQTPDFVKALEIDHAFSEDVLVAYAMNGEDLPWLNGYPLRLVVPGYFGTYWVKHLNEITVLDDIFTGFWMNPAYRIPDTAGAAVAPGTTPKSTVPITRFNVRSFITSVADGATLPAGRETVVRGIAFDGGHGITEVLFSADGGRSWRETKLGADYGRYSFREWTLPFVTKQPGELRLQSRATNRVGQTQPSTPLWNPAGYMRNVVETVRATAV